MKLENRYFVVKLSDITGSAYVDDAQVAMRRLEAIAGTQRFNRDKQPLQTIVIEKDWPEYEAVLKMLSDRVDRGDGDE